jgi:hypothetical protein
MSIIDFSLTAEQLVMYLGLSIGYLWGEAFSKFDYNITYESEWYKKLGKFQQWIIKSLLDTTHHFQMGLILILLITKGWFGLHPALGSILNWVGWGLVVSDWKEYKNVLRRFGINIPGDEE